MKHLFFFLIAAWLFFPAIASAQIIESATVFYDGSSPVTKQGFAVDAFGNTFTAVGTHSNLNFSDGSYTQGDPFKLFKHDAAGNVSWAMGAQGQISSIYDIKVGFDNKIYFSGYTSQAIVPANDNPNGTVNSPYYIANIDQDGHFVFVTTFPAKPHFAPLENGNVAFAVQAATNGTLGTEVITGGCIIYGEMSNTGQILWRTIEPNCPGSMIGMQLLQGCAAHDNRFYIYGNFSGSVTWGDNVQLNMPPDNINWATYEYSNMYVAGIDLNTHTLDQGATTLNLNFRDITTDEQGRIYLATQHFLNSNGSTDAAFMGQNFPTPMKQDAYVIRLNPDFTFDASYNVFGPALSSGSSNVLINEVAMHDGNLYILGNFQTYYDTMVVEGVSYTESQLYLVRLDDTFSYRSSAITPAAGAVVMHLDQNDDHVFVMANAESPLPDPFFHNFFIGRYKTNANVITGRAFKDFDQDGVFNNEDAPLSGSIVSTTPAALLSITRPDGTFELHVDTGEYVIEIPDAPTYYTKQPLSATVTFTANNQTENVDLTLIPVPGAHDVRVDFYALNPVVIASNAHHKILVTNEGTYPESGTVRLTPLSYSMPFNSTVTTPAMTADQGDLVYNFSSLLPGDTFSILVNYDVPIAFISILNEQSMTSVSVETVATDVQPINNAASMLATVMAGYDPNVKEVNRPALIPIETLPGIQDFSYTIHFQNEGNYHVTNVMVEDELPELLDLSSLQIIDYSDPVRATIHGNTVKFYFDSIMLPPLMDDEAGSKGFVHFRLKKTAALGLNDTVSNTASIFFDYNPAIVTNTVQNIIVDVTGLTDNTLPTVAFYPNPATTSITITLPETLQGQVSRVRLTDMTGALVLDGAFASQVSLATLAPGMYQLLLTGTNGETYAHARVVKQ